MSNSGCHGGLCCRDPIVGVLHSFSLFWRFFCAPGKLIINILGPCLPNCPMSISPKISMELHGDCLGLDSHRIGPCTVRTIDVEDYLCDTVSGRLQETIVGGKHVLGDRVRLRPIRTFVIVSTFSRWRVHKQLASSF